MDRDGRFPDGVGNAALVEAGGELIGGDSDGGLYAFRPTG